MARVTVEDCIIKVTNRFELVLLAAQRARQIGAGSPLTVERDNDKNPVVSLREIADGTVEPKQLKDFLVGSLRKHVDSEPEDEEFGDLFAEETSQFKSAADSLFTTVASDDDDDDFEDEELDDEDEPLDENLPMVDGESEEL